MRKFFLFLFVGLILLVEEHADAETTSTLNPETSSLSNTAIPSQAIPGNWDIFADFLVWFASEETSTIWASVISNTPQNERVFEAKNLSFDWDFGYRIGFGHHFQSDQWDTQFYWTWFHTKAHNSEPITNDLILSEFFGSFINSDTAHEAQIDWSLLYNMFDWELGRIFWINKDLSLRPYIGLKGGWIDQTIHSKLMDLAHSLPSASENLKNNFWGIGPSGGVNSKWKFGKSSSQFFNLFGDFSIATMWGTWVCKDVYNNPTPKNIPIIMKNSSLGALMLKGFMGIGWDTDFNKDKAHFATQLGYEMQFWLNQLRLPTFQQLRLHGDLTLQGGTFNCRFDF